MIETPFQYIVHKSPMRFYQSVCYSWAVIDLYDSVLDYQQTIEPNYTFPWYNICKTMQKCKLYWHPGAIIPLFESVLRQNI